MGLSSSSIAEPKREFFDAKPHAGVSSRVQKPLSPEDSMHFAQVPEGFKLELFAAEPNIVNPMAFAWDEKGRLYVVESYDYPHDLETNPGKDRITICEDTDGDGKADKFTKFAENQSLTSGIVCANGGVIVCQAPDMVFLKDTDGDGKADERKVLFTGFGIWDTHAVGSNLTYDLDNRILGSVGYSSLKVDKKIAVGGFNELRFGLFQFTTDGSSVEMLGQTNNNTWGSGVTEDGEYVASTANNNHLHYMGIPLRYRGYVNEGMKVEYSKPVQAHYHVRHISEEPPQQVDVRGGFTAAAGANVYTAKAYPESFHNRIALINEPTAHVVYAAEIERQGAGLVEKKLGEKGGQNLYASKDNWSAPVYSAVGPDGQVWLADWYNPVIQHNPDRRTMENQIWNAKKGRGNAHENPLRDVKHGRIYRVVYQGGDAKARKSLDVKNTGELLAALSDDNMFWRLTAQRLLVENGAGDAIGKLVELAQKEGTGSLHAMMALDGIGYFKNETEQSLEVLRSLLSGGSAAKRKMALRMMPLTPQTLSLMLVSGIMESDDPFLQKEVLLKVADFSKVKSDEVKTLLERAFQSEKKGLWLSGARKVAQSAHGIRDRHVVQGEVKKNINDEPRHIGHPVHHERFLSVRPGVLAYDKPVILVMPGDRVKLRFANPDHMPHNVVFIRGDVKEFGKVVDAFVTKPEAAAAHYIPKSDQIMAATRMLNHNEVQTIEFQAPQEPGDYPYVCTFPGHWQPMQGVLRVTKIEKSSVKCSNPNVKNAPTALMLAASSSGHPKRGSHFFLRDWGEEDSGVLAEICNVDYTGMFQRPDLPEQIKKADLLILSNNRPMPPAVRKSDY